VIAVEGVYKEGKIELSESPKGVADSSRAIVTFLDVEKPDDTEMVRQAAIESTCGYARRPGAWRIPYPKRKSLYGRGER